MPTDLAATDVATRPGVEEFFHARLELSRLANATQLAAEAAASAADRLVDGLDPDALPGFRDDLDRAYETWRATQAAAEDAVDTNTVDVPRDVIAAAHMAVAQAMTRHPYRRHPLYSTRQLIIDAAADAIWRAVSGRFGPAAGAAVLAELAAERRRQDDKWGPQNHADGTGRPGDVEAAAAARARCQANGRGEDNWRDILDEEIAEAYAEIEPGLLRGELVQAGAVIANWIEHIDRRAAAAAAVVVADAS